MYKIIGANQVEYGPVSADQLRQWIAEGRINAQTQAQAVGETGWKPIASFPEFAASFPSPTTPPPLGSPAPISPFSSPGGRQGALNEVNGPAIAMMIVGILTVAGAVMKVLWSLFGAAFANGNFNSFFQGMNLPAQQNAQMLQMFQSMQGTMGVITGILTLLLGAFVFYGGLKMKSLEQHTLCLIASILALIPCCTCCCLGIPIGIWALVVLNKTEVREFFT